MKSRQRSPNTRQSACVWLATVVGLALLLAAVFLYPVILLEPIQQLPQFLASQLHWLLFGPFIVHTTQGWVLGLCRHEEYWQSTSGEGKLLDDEQLPRSFLG